MKFRRPTRRYKSKLRPRRYVKSNTKPNLTAALRLRNIRRKRATARLRRRLGVEAKTKRYSVAMSVMNNTKDDGVNFPVDSNVKMVTPNSTTFAISQGTGQGDRLGNKIKIVDAKLRFCLLPIEYNGTTNQPLPVIIRTMFIYDKRFPTQTPTPGASGDFFQNGNSSAGFLGTLEDITRPINTDRWAVFHVRDYKVGWSTMSGMTGANSNIAYAANNDFKMMVKRTVNYTKHIVHNLRFDDLETDPAERGLWFFMYAVPATGNTADAAVFNKNAARYTLEWEMKWTDL